jgi:hypothetical protein
MILRTYNSLGASTLFLVVFGALSVQWAVASDLSSPQSLNTPLSSPAPAIGSPMTPVSQLDGVQFVSGTPSQILLTKDGKQYLIDTSNQTIFEVTPSADPHSETEGQKSDNMPKKDMPASEEKKKEEDTYYAEGIVLWTLPTSQPIEKKALLLNFTHRWAWDRAFAEGSPANFFGMDGFSVSSFGLTYGFTNRLSGGAYRVPSALGRIIQLSLGFQVSREDQGQPFSSAFRVAVEGANHFTKNYVTDLEFSLARSIRKRAQLYFVPTVSLNSRPLLAPFGEAPNLAGKTTTALGFGLSVDVRPTVAIIGEVIQRVSGLPSGSGLTEEGHNHPAFMFGIQKKIFRHTFTLGLTNSPGTTLSQRSATRGALGFPEDSLNGLTFGFNLYRRLF